MPRRDGRPARGAACLGSARGPADALAPKAVPGGRGELRLGPVASIIVVARRPGALREHETADGRMANRSRQLCSTRLPLRRRHSSVADPRALSVAPPE